MEEKKNRVSLENKKIWIVGHNGMVGNSILNKLKKFKSNILVTERKELDLRCQEKVLNWMKKKKPEVIFLAAAKVGGIAANITFPRDFLYDNIMISFNIINSAKLIKVDKLVYLGSSCIYPKNIKQPFDEGSILKGELESTNQWYALAKIAGTKLCEAFKIQDNCNFISVMPTNLYGPMDKFDDVGGHVPAALLNRFHLAKKNNLPNVTVWGSGTPLREFLYVDDLADACLFLAENYHSSQPINVGSGHEISIKNFANLVKEIVGYKGKIIFDKSKPDGMKRKLLDSKKIKQLGWKPKISLKKGLKLFYKWYVNNQKTLRK